MTREVRSSGAPPKASVALLVSVISVVIVAAAGAIAPTTTVVTPLGCVDDNDTGPDSCAQSTNGLYGARSVAVSPDGKSVYAASANDDAIVRFNRNTTTGALTPAGCVDDNDSGADACSQTADGLNSAFSVAVSPDGKSVYAASAGDDAVVRFNRNTTTGALTPAGCVDDNDTGDDTCAQSANGLQFVISVAVSADGTSVYAIAFTDSAVVRFNRNTTTGALTPAGCVDDNDTGLDTCAQSTNGLTYASSVTVSPDGKSVYATSGEDDVGGDDAIVRFNRNTSTGALTPAGCVDDNDTGADTCSQSTNGLDGAVSVAVSPSGGSVYAASVRDHAIVRFARNTTTGAITPSVCVDDNDAGNDSCAKSTDGLNSANGVAVAPNSKSVYATSAGDIGDNAVVRFAVKTTIQILSVIKNKRIGAAKLVMRVPGRGELDLAKTKTVKGMETRAAGREALPIRPTSRAKKILNDTGEVRVKAEVTYTPELGEPATKTERVTLLKRR